nr:hypothetical protein [Tanacetum cinerariifolium]
MIYSDMGPSLSIGKPLTHEEAAREALVIDICRRFSILEEERPVIKTMSYSDKYKKILDEICIDKMKLDREMKKEEEEAIIKVKGEALIEKEDPGAFVIPIRLEDKINVNALDDTGSDINVIEFGDSYEFPQQEIAIGSASESTAKKKGRTVAVTTKDTQKRRNDVKARTTLLSALPDEHQLRFSKYKTAKELWVAILKTFGGNEATKKTKKNLLKQQYGNFKAEEWLMHTIVWRNRSDLNTMSLDDLYNHLKVYEPEVQKKLDSQNMDFISSAKNSSENEEVNTTSIPTDSTQVSPVSAIVAAGSISLDTACAYIASQSNGSQIKYEDINQIDEDDIKEMNIKECRAPRSQDKGRRENYRQGSKEEEQAPKALMAIDRVGWDWSFMVNEEENHALVADEEAPTEFSLMANSSSGNEVFDNSLCSKACKKNTDSLNFKITDLSDKLSDYDTITDYSRPSPTIESNSDDLQNRNPSVTETEASSSTILSKPAINFVKSAYRPTETKTDKVKTAKKPAVKYAELYKKIKEPFQRNSAVITQVRVPRVPTVNRKFPTGQLQNKIDDKGYWDSGFSRHMTGNISYLSDYEPYDGGYVSFRQGGCKITGPLDNIICIYVDLKGHPKLRLSYPKESPFDLVAYSDSDYGGATQDQYVAAASGCGQVLWIQNQLLDYGHHFIRDCFKKKLISVDHIHTDDNVADLLTKHFDAGRFQYLIEPLVLGCSSNTHDQSYTDPTDSHLVHKSYPHVSLSVLSVHVIPNTNFYPPSNPNNTVIMARLAFCDYHNMIAILEKYEHNADFHQIVDFVEASHLRYALTINPTVYVSHIRQFWSTARIETTDEGTKILATVDGKPITISESSIRRNLKLNDKAGISSLSDAELFKNFTLMGYNILPNQKFSFQKGQFSHQWKYLIHTIMQCLSPKSTVFNEFSSNIATALVCLATNRVYNFSKMIFDGMVRNVSNKVSKFLMYLRTVPLFPTMLVTMGEGSGTPTKPHHTPSLEAPQTSPTTHSSPSLPPVTTTTILTVIPTDTPPLRANITKTSTLPDDSTPRVTSLAADEGSMQQRLNELTNLYNRLQRQQDEMASKITAQDLEISSLKARIKHLEDRDGGDDEPSREDATIKGRKVATVSIPPATISVPTGCDVVPTASPIFTTATVATPYSRRKGKEKMVESETPKKKKLQKQIDVQVAREIEEQLAREDQRMDEQIARDAEIARIHAEEELQMLINSLDRNNEIVAKYLQEHEQFTTDLSIGERIELINDLVKYQDNYAKVLKHFKGMSLEEIKEKFVPVWKQIKDFIPMGSKEEGERFKRKGLSLEQDSAKKVKTLKEVSEEDLKTMMHLVPVKEVYVEALQLWALVKETRNIRQATSDKEKELWVELKRLYEPDVEDQLWTQIQALMHDPECPLRKGLAIVMISNKMEHQVYGRIIGNKMLKAFPLPKFRIQQYLQHEHYALWEVIEFGDSNEFPQQETATGSASESAAKKKGRIVAVTTEEMQKRRNDVKARTTLLLALPDEHQLRFSKYKTAQGLWAAILKTFGGNEATKKIKKNLLKQQYDNFKSEVSETLEQTFNRLQVIVQKKSESNSHNMAFISSAKNSSENGEVNTASIPTAITQVSPAGLNVATASISFDIACAYIASQSNGSQIKYEDINQIDEDDIEEIDIKEYRAPRSQKRGRRKNYRQGSKEKEQAPKALMAIDRVGWDWSFMANEKENHALVADEEAPIEFVLMANSSSDNEEINFYEKIRGLELDLSNKNIKIERLINELEQAKKEKGDLDSKLTGFQSASKDLDNLLGSRRNDKNKEGLGYSTVPPPPAQVYYPPKKDWVDQGKTWAKNNYTHKSRSPRTVFHKTDRSPIRTNRPNTNAARPKRTCFYKPAHSYVNIAFQRNSAVRTQVRVPRVPTVNRKFPTVNRKFPT